MPNQTVTLESGAVIEITPEYIDKLRARGWPVDEDDDGGKITEECEYCREIATHERTLSDDGRYAYCSAHAPDDATPITDDESEDAVDSKTTAADERATLEHRIQLLAKRVAEIDYQQKVWWRKLRIIQDKIIGSRREKRIAMKNLAKLQVRLAALPE